ncbi:MAG: ribonuclease P protein component [Planctomycetota bacterium]
MPDAPPANPVLDAEQNAPRPCRFTRAMRLHGNAQFQSVYDRRVRKRMGPIAVAAKANGLPHDRLGLSVGRRVGSAVQRHRLKRLIREAFRLDQHRRAGGLDLVVVVYPHEPRALEEYRRLLADAYRSLRRRLVDPAAGREGSSGA